MSGFVITNSGATLIKNNIVNLVKTLLCSNSDKMTRFLKPYTIINQINKQVLLIFIGSLTPFSKRS